MATGKPSPKRCAIYTRKSSEEGLEQDFNSLHAQREACEHFIFSQKAEGWRLVEAAYDDGGFSGGTMERPALQRLLADIRARRIDVVVVYKIDRLTRALADFARMVEVFDGHGVSFVAVTQQFNTTTSMGRLTLNILLSFAQFEREVTGERIRDKIAASKQKGMWMGGTVPLGYDVIDRRLVVNPAEAETVQTIFRRYLDLGCVRRLKEDLQRQGVRAKARRTTSGIRPGGGIFARGALYALLANPLYIGEIRHKDARHPGLHEAIVDRTLWDEVQQRLAANLTSRRSRPGKVGASPLVGKLFDSDGDRLTPSHAVKGGRRYRYYVSHRLVTGSVEQARQGWRLPATAIERCVADVAATMLADRAALVATAREAGIAANKLPAFLAAAATLRERLRVESDGAIALADAVERIMVAEDGLLLTLPLAPLLPEGTAATDPAALLLTRRIPMIVKRRGVEMRLVIAGSAAAAKADPVLVKAIARGTGWFQELARGAAPTITAIAAREGVSDRYIAHHLPLAFLAPDIVEAILTGRQPADLTADTLFKRIDLPLDWQAQKTLLGFG